MSTASTNSPSIERKTPVRHPKEEQKFEDAMAMIHRRFGNAMKKLAE